MTCFRRFILTFVLTLVVTCSSVCAQETLTWNQSLRANQPANLAFNKPKTAADPEPNNTTVELETIPIRSKPDVSQSPDVTEYLVKQAEQLSSREGTASTIQIGLLLAALSLAPALVLMTTSYVRVIVVLGLLRQAFGAQQLPPTQVLTSLSLFLTLLIMAPVWSEIKTEAIDPYSQSSQELDWQEAWNRGVVPVKKFMTRQIAAAENGDAIATFYQYLPEDKRDQPSSFEDIPLNVLLPAFMISELKVAFLLGFQIYLPFLVVDLVVSSVTVSMGMLMLPPTMVSFPLKLILFVMVDGWNLVVGMLLQSFGPFV